MKVKGHRPLSLAWFDGKLGVRSREIWRRCRGDHGRYRGDIGFEGKLGVSRATPNPNPSPHPNPNPNPNRNPNPNPIPNPSPNPTPIPAQVSRLQARLQKRGLYLPYISLYLPYISLPGEPAAGAATEARPGAQDRRR